MINHPSDIEEIVQIGYEMTELQAFNIYQPSITYFEPSVDLHIPGRPCIGFFYITDTCENMFEKRFIQIMLNSISYKSHFTKAVIILLSDQTYSSNCCVQFYSDSINIPMI